jgi:diguanylate cyclase (GGDEF)-like protein
MSATGGASTERRRSLAGGEESMRSDRERRLVRFLESRSTASVFACSLALLALIGWIDYVTGPEIGVSIFYLIPLALVAWRSGGLPALGLSILGAVEWYLAEAYGGRTYSNPLAACWNAAIRFGFFATVTSLIGVTSRLVDHERELARTDPVTGLANARHFYQVAESRIQRARAQSRALTIAYVDIDEFKQVNDRLGHAAGDDVIRAVGASMVSGVRATDLASRLGVDEVALLLPETPYGAATAVLRRLSERLDSLARKNGWLITFSIGAVTTSSPGSVDDLIRRADALMYEVKRNGKNGLRHELLSGSGA